MGQQKSFISPTSTISRSLFAAVLAVIVLSSFSIQQTSALTCQECCSCQGDSQACAKNGAPLFNYINTKGTIQCGATSNACGTIRLMDITNNQALTLKSCFHSNMCAALARLVGTDIPFFYLGDINTRVISVNCCNSDNCNVNAASSLAPSSKLLLAAVILLVFTFLRR